VWEPLFETFVRESTLSRKKIATTLFALSRGRRHLSLPRPLVVFPTCGALPERLPLAMWYSGFMAGKKNIHTVPYGDKWAVIEEGSSTPLGIHGTKEKAMKHGREEAKKRGVEHFIHGRDGKIQDRESYGKDPYPPKDRKH
jgi:hypothetical protein